LLPIRLSVRATRLLPASRIRVVWADLRAAAFFAAAVDWVGLEPLNLPSALRLTAAGPVVGEALGALGLTDRRGGHGAPVLRLAGCPVHVAPAEPGQHAPNPRAGPPVDGLATLADHGRDGHSITPYQLMLL